MRRRLQNDIRDWLTAERDRSDDLAEQALRRAFTELGRRAPVAGFADRALLRASRFAPASRAWRPWWLRLSIAACLVAAGLVIALLPAWWPTAGAVARALGSPVVSACSYWSGHWINAGFAFWAVIQDLAAAARASLVTPAALLVLSANVLLAATSLFGLKRLLKPSEELMPW